MKQVLACVFIITCLASCKKELEGGRTSFADNFEDTAFTRKEWRKVSTVDGNEQFSDTFAQAGNHGFYFYAVPSGDEVSKSSRHHQDLNFNEGDLVRFSAWYYVDADDLANLFICDLEESAYISSSPGMRLMIDYRGQLLLERNKMEMRTVQQIPGAERTFPKRQWVRIEFECKLTRKKKGYVKVWQDGALIIDVQNTRTLAKDFIYATQGTVGIMNSIEVGITANWRTAHTRLWIDEVEIRKIN